jgi:hypothetical protein
LQVTEAQFEALMITIIGQVVNFRLGIDFSMR